jgi:hypothetical protein
MSFFRKLNLIDPHEMHLIFPWPFNSVIKFAALLSQTVAAIQLEILHLFSDFPSLRRL